MKLPKKSLERNLFTSGSRLIYAVDEGGMGCLAGPVVVCAVAFKKKFFDRRHKKLHWLRDSKLLLAHQREEYARQLTSDKNIKFQVSYVYPKTIDQLNIYNAARFAMKRAINKLSGSCRSLPHGYSINFRRRFPGSSSCEPSPLCPGVTSRAPPLIKSIVLVDGKTKIRGLKMEQLPIVKGDRKVFAIACASIIAKVARDRTMVRLAKKYPQYGLEKHKGYPTKLHKAMHAKHGICRIHRKSFKPVAKLL